MVGLRRCVPVGAALALIILVLELLEPLASSGLQRAPERRLRFGLNYTQLNLTLPTVLFDEYDPVCDFTNPETFRFQNKKQVQDAKLKVYHVASLVAFCKSLWMIFKLVLPFLLPAKLCIADIIRWHSDSTEEPWRPPDMRKWNTRLRNDNGDECWPGSEANCYGNYYCGQRSFAAAGLGNTTLGGQQCGPTSGAMCPSCTQFKQSQEERTTISRRQGEQLCIEAVQGKISRAWYGAAGHEWSSSKGQDVTHRVKELLSRSNFINISQENFGDPSPHATKILLVETDWAKAECPTCSATGFVRMTEDVCHRCNGRGMVIRNAYGDKEWSFYDPKDLYRATALHIIVPNSETFDYFKTLWYFNLRLSERATVSQFFGFKGDMRLPWSNRTQVLLYTGQLLAGVVEIARGCLYGLGPFWKFYSDVRYWELTFRMDVFMYYLYLVLRYISLQVTVLDFTIDYNSPFAVLSRIPQLALPFILLTMWPFVPAALVAMVPTIIIMGMVIFLAESCWCGRQCRSLERFLPDVRFRVLFVGLLVFFPWMFAVDLLSKRFVFPEYSGNTYLCGFSILRIASVHDEGSIAFFVVIVLASSLLMGCLVMSLLCTQCVPRFATPELALKLWLYRSGPQLGELGMGDYHQQKEIFVVKREQARRARSRSRSRLERAASLTQSYGNGFVHPSQHSERGPLSFNPVSQGSVEVRSFPSSDC